MTIRRVAALLCCGLAVLVFAACGSDSGDGSSADTTEASGGGGDEGNGDGTRIGVVLADLNNPFIADERDGLVAEAEARGYELLISGSNDGAENVSAFETYLAQQVDLMIISTVDAAAMVPAVETANEQGVPVIGFQSSVPADLTKTFVAPDNYAAGVTIGEAIVEWCEDIDPCKLGVVQGSFADPSGVAENEGMEDTIEKHPNIDLVGGSPTEYDPAKALNVASDLLAANPDINYLYAWWDQGALSALEAVRDKGLEGEVGISGFTGTCPAVAEVIKGNLYQDPMYFAYSQGQYTLAKAAQVLEGEELPAETPWPFFSLTTPIAEEVLAGKSDAEFPPAEIVAQLESEPRDLPEELERAEGGC